jgi:hypothetical protein
LGNAITTRLTRVAGLGFEAEFASGVEEVKQLAEGNPDLGGAAPMRELETQTSAIPSQFQQLAETEPRAAVLLGFLEVEHAADEALRRFDLPAEQMFIRKMASLNGRLGYFPIAPIVNELRALRNQVSHKRDAVVSSESAHEYLRLCDFVVSWLDARDPTDHPDLRRS